jgi:hypothetical protein
MLRGRHLITILFFLFLFSVIRAQDIIYLNNGDKFEAVVKELNVVSIRYKNFANQDGPTYVIKRSDILFIEYQNGTIEVINKNPVSVSPAKTETVAPKKEIIQKGPYDQLYMNKSCLYLNGLALVNSDIALIYDREIAKSRASIVLLGAYNFNIHTNYTNRYIQALNNSKKNYDLGIGINYYTQARRKSQYFVGFLLKYMNYDYVRQTIINDTISGVPYQTTKQQGVNNFQLAGMIVNGLQFRITPYFTYRAFIGVGFTNKDSDISKAVRENTTEHAHSLAKAYLGMCVGYRFF